MSDTTVQLLGLLYCVAAVKVVGSVYRWSHSETRRRELAVRRLKKQARR